MKDSGKAHKHGFRIRGSTTSPHKLVVGGYVNIMNG